MNIPPEWGTEVLSKWHLLEQKYEDSWSFVMEQLEGGCNMHLTALLKSLDGKRHVQYEIVHEAYFDDPARVCAKIDSLEKKVFEFNKLTL